MNGDLSSVPAICPKCANNNMVRGQSMTLAMTCAKCGTYFALAAWTKVQVEFTIKSEPAIPIGSRGKLKGITYEVMGFVVKHIRKYKFSWREYVLFNTTHGLAYLSESDGHWNYVIPLKDNPQEIKGSRDFEYEGSSFRLYQKYKANVYYAKGEFFTDIFTLGEDSIVEEYIAPPYLLSLEFDDTGYRWYHGEYIDHLEVARAFRLMPDKLPPKIGRGYIQPYISAFSAQTLFRLCIALFTLIFCIQLIFINTAEQKLVLSQSFFSYQLAEGQKMFVTPSFKLDNGSKSLVIKINAPLTNDWFFGGFVLVNEDNLTEIEFSKEIVFYSGVDEGYSWTEGSRNGEAFLSKIPDGNYHINVYPEFSNDNKEFSIRVVSDVWNMGNMWVVCAIVFAFPLFYFIRFYRIESKRWSDSDYSPYGK